MEKLSRSQRCTVLRCLMEGSSVASTTRITGIAGSTISRYLAEAGEACTHYQDKVMRNLPCKVLQLDEVWSFVGCKEKSKKHAKGEHPGDVWTWTAICADTKLIPSWRVGDRGQQAAFEFCGDLSKRFNGRLQITSDGLSHYRWAVGSSFGNDNVDFAQLVKKYALDQEGNEVCVGAIKVPRLGNPAEALISTSYVERSNLTVRMTNRRFTRKTNAFSKKLANHCHSLAITMMNYNFCRKHLTTKTTPSQAAGIADHQWSLDEVVQMIETRAEQRMEESFETAFALKFTPKHVSYVRTPTPKDQIPLPWYLQDPKQVGESGHSELP